VENWILEVIDRLGPAGVGLLIALENLIPPIPSELILPLAGYQARTGDLNPVLVWGSATLGALAGALALYGLGAWLGYERLHRLAGRPWFILTSQGDLKRGHDIFDRHSSWIVAGARCVPVLRSLVSIPAGINRMPLPRFMLLTVLGSGVWNAAFITAGYRLADHWEVVGQWTAPVSYLVVVLIVAALIWSAVRKMRSP
jgi:membrane protein DedA with SNARE-associated domain